MNISKIDDMSGHKTSLHKFKRIEIIRHLSDHRGMKLGVNYMKKTGKFANNVEIKQHASE